MAVAPNPVTVKSAAAGNREHAAIQQLFDDEEWRLKDTTYLFEFEWDVVSGQAQHGKGDAVFVDQFFSMARVIEVKALNQARIWCHHGLVFLSQSYPACWAINQLVYIQGEGHTASVARTKARKEGKAQALKYGRAFKNKHPDLTVQATICLRETDGTISLQDVKIMEEEEEEEGKKKRLGL